MAAERRTKQQAAIERAVTASQRPLSSGEVLARARRTSPTLSLATIYRTLKRLEADGAIARVEIAGQPTRFESHRAASTHHHHFVCRECDRVLDIPGCARGVEGLAPAGFTVDSHEIVLFGLCDQCSDHG
jgi:Fur family ferric uptake transcriptional regulator